MLTHRYFLRAGHVSDLKRVGEVLGVLAEGAGYFRPLVNAEGFGIVVAELHGASYGTGGRFVGLNHGRR